MLTGSTPPRRLLLKFAVSASLGLAGCGGQDEGGGEPGGPGGPGGGRPIAVGYVVVQPTSVPIVSDLTGRTVAFRSSEVRPQATGVIQKQLFTEGSAVRQGQSLYRIDPSLYLASVNEAKANLASAQASAAAARVRADRLRPLAEMEAVSKQDYTDAQATARQAAASIAQNRAVLASANTNLRFTTVPAPISGRIGRSLFTVGALVTTSQVDPLATIQQLDPIYVDIQQSSADLLALRRALATDGVVPTRTEVRLRLEDDSDYGATGTVEFSEVVVDPSTGTVTLRARFPNRDGLLLPGMFVRARFAQAIDRRAFLVPQEAVSRDPRGNATVSLVGPGNTAITRTVRADRAQGRFWVVTEGLKPGDKVITQGLSKLRPGARIKAVPAAAPERVQAPPRGKPGGG